MSNCLTCGGLITDPNAVYGYAGKVCACFRPQQVQRPASETFHMPLVMPVKVMGQAEMEALYPRKPIVKLTIPGRVISLKNSKRVICRGRFPRVLPSARYERWRKDAIAAHSCSFKGHLVDYPCEIHARFYFLNRANEADLSNMIQGPEDLMQQLGILKDDKLIHRAVTEKFFGHEPRVEIEIYKYNPPTGREVRE